MKKRFFCLLVSALFVIFAVSASADTVINKYGDAEDPAAVSEYVSNSTLSVVTDPYNSSNKCFYVKPGTAQKTWTYFKLNMDFEAIATYIVEYDVALGKDTNGNDYSAKLSYNAYYSEGAGNTNHSAAVGETISTSSGWVHQKFMVVVSSKYTKSDGSYIGMFVSPQELSDGAFVNRSYYIDNFVVKKVPTMTFNLSPVFSDNMMLQNGKDVKIFGTTLVTEDITVTLYDKTGKEVRNADAEISDGQFAAYIPALTDTSGDAYTLRITQGDSVKTIENVIFGEVWLFSGQSNMELTVGSCTSKDHSAYKDMLPDKEYPSVRIFISGDNGAGEWKVVNPTNVNAFSAVTYNTVMALHEELGVPVGGISTAQGGISMAENTAPCPEIPNGGKVYNSRTKPVAGYTIKGFFWYQGENDRANNGFVKDFEIFLNSWRAVWDDTDNSLPFYYVQLPQSPAKIWHISGGEFMTSSVKYNTTRLYQNEFLSKHEDENVAMIVTVDTVEKIDRIYTNVDTAGQDPLHPWNKKPVGERLAYIALEKTYGRNDIEGDSPRISDISVSGNVVTLKYANVAGGLVTEDGENPRFFEVAGEDGVYYSADATITGKDTITLVSDKVANPVKAAYFYEDHFVDYSDFFKGNDINLFGGTGLPVMPEVVSLPHQIVYDLDGGNGNIVSESYFSGETFTLPAAAEVTKSGYELRGWFDGVKVTRQGEDYTISTEATGTINFKAVWVNLSAPKYGLVYEFDTEDGFAGWGANTATCTVSDGLLCVTSTGHTYNPQKNDPRLTSPAFSLDASTYTKLIISVKNTATENSGAFRFKRTGDESNVGTCHSLGNFKALSTAPNSTEFVEYVIDLSAQKNWYGTIDRFWLDVVHTYSGTAYVDYIRFARDDYDTADFNDATAVSMHKRSIRVKAPSGIRFASYVTAEHRKEAYEYGYIVSTRDILGTTELTFDCGKKYALGVAYRNDGSVDVVYSKDDDKVVFTSVLTNIPEKEYKTVIIARPYLKIENSDGTLTTRYGEEMSGSIYEVACLVLADENAVLTDEERAYLEAIANSDEIIFDAGMLQ